VKLGDLLSVAGNSPLDHTSYNWSTAVLGAINNVLPADHRLTETNTAAEALAAINCLSVDDRVAMLTIRVDTLTGTLKADEPAVHVDDAATAPVAVVPARDPRQLMALGVGAVVVVIALMMATVSAVNTAKTGQPADTQSMTQLFSILMDLFKALAAPAPSN
jgi:hypothetical protein